MMELLYVIITYIHMKTLDDGTAICNYYIYTCKIYT